MLASADTGRSDNGKPESNCSSWRLWQTQGTDLAAESLKESEKRARCDSDTPDILRLKTLFSSLAGANGLKH